MKIQKIGLSAVVAAFLLCAAQSDAQEHVRVPLEDPVYAILETGLLKGAVADLSSVKPYSKSTVVSLLGDMRANGEKLSPYERRMVDELYERFVGNATGLQHGRIGFEGTNGTFFFGGSLFSNFRINTAEPIGEYHTNNTIRAYIAGDIGKDAPFSYLSVSGIAFDKLSPVTFAPYGYHKPSDGFYVFTDGTITNGRTESPSLSFILEADLAAHLANDTLILRFSRTDRDWGFGNGSLVLSQTARPFIGFDLHFRPVEWFALSQVVGSLGDWFAEAEVKTDPDAVSQQKMLTIQKVELFPFNWLYLSAGSAAVWGKRFEIGYLSPLLMPILYQNVVGDFDNLAMFGTLGFVVPKIGKLYFTFFLDEALFINLEDYFTRPRNMFAYQTGFEVPVPGLPFTVFTFQYTKLEPFVYTHYQEEYPFFSNPVDMSYTNDGELLGYPLAPNSDEFLISIRTVPHPQVTASLAYRLIRHGTNDPDIAGELAVYGDIDQPLNIYLKDAYPDKDFLNDGLYDWNNIVTLKGSFRFKKLPVTVSAEYCFAHTFWVENESGIAPPADQIRNIFSLSVELF